MHFLLVYVISQSQFGCSEYYFFRLKEVLVLFLVIKQ